MAILRGNNATGSVIANQGDIVEQEGEGGGVFTVGFIRIKGRSRGNRGLGFNLARAGLGQRSAQARPEMKTDPISRLEPGLNDFRQSSKPDTKQAQPEPTSSPISKPISIGNADNKLALGTWRENENYNS